jgi:regulator of PEP synthase PpsR (kinase-PPPase family)
MYYVFAVSDGTGGTAARALKAALTQFESVEVEIILRPTIRTVQQIQSVVSEASLQNGLIVHTLVSDDVRAIMINECRLQNVEQIDIMGPLLARLSQQVSITPSEKPGLFSQLNEDYFRRIETMEFAFHHDDGLRVDEIEKAEIVLLGVSRTFKTPLSIYLAFKGWFVANIPIINEIEPPEILDKLNPKFVFCLITDTHHLVLLRQARESYLGGATGEYASFEYVKNELLYARRIYDRHPDWTMIDVTNKPIEEIASEILLLVKSRESN